MCYIVICFYVSADRLFAVSTCDIGIKALVTMNTTVSNLTTTAKKHGLKRELNETEVNEDAAAEKRVCKEERVKRRKFAMLLAYCGQGYFGLQR